MRALVLLLLCFVPWHSDAMDVLTTSESSDSLDSLHNNLTIYAAASMGNIDRVKELLDTHKIRVDTVYSFKHTPLYYAVKANQVHMVNFLLERNAHVSFEILNKGICTECSTQILKSLIEKFKKTNNYLRILLRTAADVILNKMMQEAYKKKELDSPLYRSSDIKAHDALSPQLYKAMLKAIVNTAQNKTIVQFSPRGQELVPIQLLLSYGAQL